MTDSTNPEVPEGEPYPRVALGPDAQVITTAPMTASGGWAAPFDSIYSTFPEVTARRGGLTFAAPLSELPNEDLVRMLNQEREALRREIIRNRKLRRKINRLLAVIGRIA